MISNKFASQVKQLLNQVPKSFSALHGTSISFIKQMLDSGAVYSDRPFFVLVPSDHKGADIIEAATYYAQINAVKDLLFSEHPDLAQKVITTLDSYLFLTGLGQAIDNPRANFPADFSIFTAQELELIRSVIDRVKSEDRRGIIIYFNSQFLKDFPVLETTDTGQAKVQLSQPITFNHLQAIQLLGSFEKSSSVLRLL